MSAKKKSGELRCFFASALHWRRIRGWRIRSSARFLVALPNIIARSFARFKARSLEKTPRPNFSRISCFTSGSSTRSCAAWSALKNFAAGRISRRHSQKVLLPVEIPPVIPIAGISSNHNSAFLNRRKQSCCKIVLITGLNLTVLNGRVRMAIHEMKKQRTVLEVLFSQVRAELLRLLFTPPHKERYVRELMRMSGLRLSTVQDELRKLSALELVTSRSNRYHRFYRANRDHSLFPNFV